MSQHTPGPWTYSSGMVWAGHGEEIAIAHADRDKPRTRPTERDDNARLIAKAPEMYELLQLKLNDPVHILSPEGYLNDARILLRQEP